MRMTRGGVALVAGGAALAALVVWLAWPFGLGGPGTGDDEARGPLLEKTVSDDGAGGVTVTATRLAAAEGDRTVRFGVRIETHTVALEDYDPTAGATLEDRDGVRHLPAEGSQVTEGSSHHKAATLVFERPTGTYMVLVIRDLAGVPERRLVFD